MTSLDVAWLAGLLEGEGTFFRPRRYGTLRVVLGMTDRDIVERAASLVGRPSVYEAKRKNKKPHHKTQYWWMLTGHSAAAVMMTIYSFMGERRRTKIQQLLEEWRSTPYKKRINPVTLCEHKARRHYAHGFCKSCYDKSRSHRGQVLDTKHPSNQQPLLAAAP